MSLLNSRVVLLEAADRSADTTTSVYENEYASGGAITINCSAIGAITVTPKVYAVDAFGGETLILTGAAIAAAPSTQRLVIAPGASGAGTAAVVLPIKFKVLLDHSAAGNATCGVDLELFPR